jgi:hypothetical protein
VKAIKKAFQINKGISPGLHLSVRGRSGFDFEKGPGVVSQYTGKEDGPAYEN